MTPLLANGINVSYVLLLGALVLIPLMAFEVFVESAILRWGWKLSWDDLVGFTLRANLWSLVAGIPVKFLNAALYESNLPKDLPGFFESYPLWVGIGTGIYFVVTVAAEALYAFRIVGEAGLSFRRIFGGILVANVVTYAVLAPVYYAATKPHVEGIKFTRDAKFAEHPETRLVFIDSMNSHLKAGRLDGTEIRTIVPAAVAQFQVSMDLKTCLYRGEDGNLYLFNAETLKDTKVFETGSRIAISECAFSPNGRYVALLQSRNKLIVADLESGGRSSFTFSKREEAERLAWSTEEKKFYIDLAGTNRFSVATIGGGERLTVEPSTDSPVDLSEVYVSGPFWSYDNDTCGNLEAWAETGMGGYLHIRHKNDKAIVFRMRINMGLLGLSAYGFNRVAFLPNCNELISESKGYLYLLNLKGSQIGTIGAGKNFILLTDRFKASNDLTW